MDDFFQILLQFDAVENGMHSSKMMQVFSKQAPMMDALISHFAEQMRRRKLGENGQPPESVAEGKFNILSKNLENQPIKFDVFVFCRTKSNSKQWLWRFK